MMGASRGERKRAKQALDQAKRAAAFAGRLQSRPATDPAAAVHLYEVPSEAHEIEDILAVAHKRDEEIAKARETAQYAGDADPYKHPEERDDDEFDDDDEYDEYADDLDVTTSKATASASRPWKMTPRTRRTRQRATAEPHISGSARRERIH